MSSILLVLVYVACVDPNPPLPPEGERKPLECSIIAAEARSVTEESARALSKACLLSPTCDERRPGVFVVRSVSTRPIERRL